VLGEEKSASVRVSIAQGCTALGSIMAPVIGSALFLGDKKTDIVVSNLEKASQVQLPFLVIMGIFLVLAVVFGSMKLPEMKSENAEATSSKFNISNYPWLLLGIIGIFIYMGGQIGIINLFFLPYLKEKAGFDAAKASEYLSYFFILQMLGRFGGSALMARFPAGPLLAISAFGMIATIALVMVLPGDFAPVLFVLMGLFDSVCFGNIFSLSIKGLGEHTKTASSFLFMAVLGGAILPPTIGKVVDVFGMQTGLLVAAACYGYVLFFGLIGHKTGQKLTSKSV
jgi:FHS family L-fucose permease-like MFS transporter